MKFKLGLLIGAGISYLASSGKGKELLAQVRERTGVGAPGASGRVEPSGAPAGMAGRAFASGSAFPDPGSVPDAFGTTLITEEETVIVETDELGSARR